MFDLQCVRRSGALMRALRPTLLLFILALSLALATRVPAMAALRGNAAKAAMEQDHLESNLINEVAGCEPPTTRDWVLIGTGSLIIFVVCFLLLVRLVQRYFIHRDLNPTLGRHAGISLTFAVGSLGMVALAYLVTGCLHKQFLLWLCFPLALLLLHGIYTLVVVRNE